jgi:hypothetical protein
MRALGLGFFALLQTAFARGAPPDFAAFGAAIASTHSCLLLSANVERIKALLITRSKNAAKSIFLTIGRPIP